MRKKLSDLLFEFVGQQMPKTIIIHLDRLKPYHSGLVPDWVPSVRKSVLQENKKKSE